MADFDGTFVSRQGARHVAFVHDTVDSTLYGGQERHMVLLMRYFDRSRYSPVLLVSGYTDRWRASPERLVREVQELGLPVLRSPHPGDTRGLSFASDILNTTCLLKRARIDVVHIHTARAEGARRATISARLANIPALVRTEHLPPSRFATPRSRYAVKLLDWATDRIVVVSESNRREQISLLHRDEKRLVVSYNGSELDRFRPTHDMSAAKQRLDLAPSVPVVGVVARLDAQKGLRYFLDAAASVVSAHGTVTFLIVGDGPLRQELENQTAHLGLASQVHFVGWQEDPLPYIEAMDIAVVPSLYEGFSLALLDFMAMAKPVVATRVQGNEDAVIDGDSGLLVAPSSGNALALGILSLLRDPVLAKRLGQGALQRVRAAFSIQNSANEIMDLYDTILADKSCKG